MLQGLVKKKVDKRLNSVEIEKRLIRKTDGLASLPRHLTRMAEVMLDNQDYIAPVSSILKKETEKAVHIK